MKRLSLIVMLTLPACVSHSATTASEDQITDQPILIPQIRQTKPVTISTDVSNVSPSSIVSHAADPSLRPFQRIEKANAAAKVEPGLENYYNAVQVYPYTEGALYQLYAAPGQVSLISLQKGEELIAISAGDTERWMVGDTVSGSGATSQVNIMVKPLSAGLQTNLVITTSKRTYLLELRSFRSTYMAALSWRYPAEQMPLKKITSEGAEIEEPHFKLIDPDDVLFRYDIVGPKVSWRPARVFDDSRKTYIEFSKTIRTSETPPLFIISDSKVPELVNYRVRGQFYIVDRLFQTAELRLGGKKQSIIRIERQEVTHDR